MPNQKNDIKGLDVVAYRDEITKALARKSHLEFVRHCWFKAENFVVGIHTKAICDKIDEMMEKFRQGITTFTIIKVPFRHGKPLSVDTPIYSDYGCKFLGDIKEGNEVESWKFTGNNGHEGSIVTEVHDQGKLDVMLITTATGGHILSAPDHSFFTQDGWQRAENLWVGMCLKRLIGWHDLVSDEIVSIEDGGSRECRCLTVEPNGNFFANGYLVHNSELVARYMIPHFVGEYPEQEVMLTSYGSDLSEGFARVARRIMRSDKYQQLYPHVKLSKESASVGEWKLDDYAGEVHITSFGGAQTGRGYHCGICDDYLKDIVEAESTSVRNNRWNIFRDDFLTRRAPVSMTLITATPRHVDDIIGRIIKRMKEDPKFPKFEIITFPAFSDKYPEGILFPERYDREWYDYQKATVVHPEALLQCDPVEVSGNLFNIDGIKYHENITEFPDIQYVRSWDLAHTERQRISDDPDWTVGTLMGISWSGPETQKNASLWIKNIQRFRKNAPQRDKRIREITEDDGPHVKVCIECAIDSKDAYETFKKILRGNRSVKKIIPSADKTVRALPLEPIFEAGNVHILTAEWNEHFVDEVRSFPKSRHDDQIDTLSCGGIYLGLGGRANQEEAYRIVRGLSRIW